MRKLSLVSAVLFATFIFSCQKEATHQPQDEFVTGKGNNVPSGKHFNLNIIGVPKEKNPNFDGGNGHRIFVKLEGRTRILLREGDFAVLDANGTDGEASFQLPEPDANDDDITDYSVYVRGLGKPGGQSFITSCYFDQQDQMEYCSSGGYIVNVTSHGNNNKFQNVTKELLYIWADVDGDGDLDRVELFSDPLDEYYWYYDNDGLKIAQMRFYPNVGTAIDPDPEPQ